MSSFLGEHFEGSVLIRFFSCGGCKQPALWSDGASAGALTRLCPPLTRLTDSTSGRGCRGTCLGRFLWDPALQKETGRKREVFPSHRKRTWIDHFCQRQTIGDEKSIYLARTLPQSHSEPKSGRAQFSQGPLGGKVMEGRDYWGARPPHPPYPGI